MAEPQTATGMIPDGENRVIEDITSDDDRVSSNEDESNDDPVTQSETKNDVSTNKVQTRRQSKAIIKPTLETPKEELLQLYEQKEQEIQRLKTDKGKITEIRNKLRNAKQSLENEKSKFKTEKDNLEAEIGKLRNEISNKDSRIDYLAEALEDDRKTLNEILEDRSMSAESSSNPTKKKALIIADSRSFSRKLPQQGGTTS